MANAIVVKPGDAQNFIVKYEDGGDANKRTVLENGWKRFNRPDPATGQTFYIWYRPTNRKTEVTVDYRMPPNSLLGVYRVEVFVPGKYATSKKAVFSIAHNYRVENGVPKTDDPFMVVDMNAVSDVWVSLGEYLLDPMKNPVNGRVRQINMSLEDPAASMTFAPVRWVPLATTGQPATEPATPASPEVPAPAPAGVVQFDAPMGTPMERNGTFLDGILRTGFGPIWFGNWYDATPYLTWYFLGAHTGADLNLIGTSDADKDAPIFSIGDGKVVYAGAAGSWGNIIVIEHPNAKATLPDGRVQQQRVFSRYGHVTSNILVAKGDQVPRGKNIGFIGLATGMTTGWHLHFDIIYSDIGNTRPSHWPNMTKIKQLKADGQEGTRDYANAQAEVRKEVMAHYLDPLLFLKNNHQVASRGAADLPFWVYQPKRLRTDI